MEAPRIEVHSFCDIAVGRDLLKISPEFLVFLPCRIAVMEDADKNIWVIMLDWNMHWVGGYEGQMAITPELARGANDLRNKMDQIMRAGANGDRSECVSRVFRTPVGVGGAVLKNYARYV